MNRNILFAGLAIVALASCKKYKTCDNAEGCVKNVGTDTIRYGWNTSSWSEKLAPGETTCNKVGEINTDPNNGNSSTITFNSDHGSYGITVDDCHIEKEID